VLTGVAALLTALGGLIVALHPFVAQRLEPAPAPPASRVVAPLPSSSGSTAAPERRPEGSPATLPAMAEPRPASQPGPAARTETLGRSGAPPVRLGEAFDVGGSSFEVMNLEISDLPNGLREVRVTFQVMAGPADLVLSRGVVRVLDVGRVHSPVEGLATTQLPSGRRRQFWVRFVIEGPLREPVLSFRDHEFTPRGEARRTLPDP
jgi:hypothetical protein